MKVSLQDAAATARRQLEVLFPQLFIKEAGAPAAIITADDSGIYPISAADSPLSVIDFSQISTAAQGRFVVLTITGSFGLVAGGTATNCAIVLTNPDGVFFAQKVVPFLDAAGFTVSFELPDVPFTKFWIYAALGNTTGAPTTTVGSLRFSYIQAPENSGSGSFSI